VIHNIATTLATAVVLFATSTTVTLSSAGGQSSSAHVSNAEHGTGRAATVANNTSKQGFFKGLGGKAKPPAIRVTASELAKDYTSNRIAADAKYEGKQIRITGTVTGFQEVGDYTYAVLDTGNPRWLVGIAFDYKILPDKIANVKKGQKITVDSPSDPRVMDWRGFYTFGGGTIKMFECKNCAIVDE